MSFEFPFTAIQSKLPSQTLNKYLKFQQLIPQGFKRILFLPDKAAQVIAACKERLLKTKVIGAPFLVAEIQGGILKQHLINEDYAAPLMVSLVDFPQVANDLPNSKLLRRSLSLYFARSCESQNF